MAEIDISEEKITECEEDIAIGTVQNGLREKREY